MDFDQVRPFVLRRMGLKLPGRAGPHWAGEILDAAGRAEPELAVSARKLAWELTGESWELDMSEMSSPQRQHVVRLFLADRGLLQTPASSRPGATTKNSGKP